MLHLLYVLAFTILAFLAVGNLIRTLLRFSSESQRPSHFRGESSAMPSRWQAPHPELLDDRGNTIQEPLMVVRSIGVEDARQKLDALYRSSPGFSDDEIKE